MKTKKIKILLTGGTGFLGKQILKSLAPHAEVTSLSRKADEKRRADFTLWDAGISASSLTTLKKEKFDLFFHIAGLYDLRCSEKEALKQNVFATHTALSLAHKLEIPHFAFISTLAVAIGEKGEISPQNLNIFKKFPDHYSSTKAHAEQLVRYWDAPFKSRLILRPGILIGDSEKGSIERIDGPYHFPEFFRKIINTLSLLPTAVPLPGNANSSLPLVPIDIAAQACVKILLHHLKNKTLGTECYHVFPKEGVLISDLYRSTFDYLGLQKQRFRLFDQLPKNWIKVGTEKITQLPRQEMEYLLSLPSYDTSSTDKVLGKNWCPTFEKYSPQFWRGYEEFLSHR